MNKENATPQLACRDLTLGYEGVPIVSGLSFDVYAGAYVCIVGENGSGKTTLMQTILKLKSPMGGEVAWGDGLRPGQAGYLPQQTDVQRDFPASVREVVLSGCLNRCGLRPYFRAEEKQLAQDTLEKLGLAALAKRCYRELSGGQQQRVLLARALCAGQKMLLLDEPVSGLDPSAAAEMYALIRELNREGMTVLMISHDIEASCRYASHILHLGEASAFFGTAADYRKGRQGRDNGPGGTTV